MHFRDRKYRSWAPLVLLALAAAGVAAGCQDRAPTDPGDDTPQFAKPPAADVGLTLRIEAANENGADYAGPLYALVYDEMSGLEEAAAFDCGTPQTIDGVDYCTNSAGSIAPIFVSKGSKAVVIVPGSVSSGFPFLLPLQGNALPTLDCTPPSAGAASPCTIGASVTDDPRGQPPLGLRALTPTTLFEGFDIKLNNDLTVVLGPPVAASVLAHDYRNFGPDGTNGDSDDDNVDFTEIGDPTTVTVMPLCPGEYPATWVFGGPTNPDFAGGVWPAVPVAFATAAAGESEVFIPYPFGPVPGDRSCSEYPGGSLPYWVTELNFLDQQVGAGTLNTILQTFEIRSPDDLVEPITLYAQPLVCDASLSKSRDPYEVIGDAAKIDILPPIVPGYQAEIGPGLSLTPVLSKVSGWYTQHVPAWVSNEGVTFTLKAESPTRGNLNFNVTYSCSGGDPAGCAVGSVQGGSGTEDLVAQFNFRNPAARDGFDSAALVETTWSIIGLPEDSRVRISIRTTGDKWPLAPGDDLEQSDWPIEIPETCKDTNDGRWAV